MTPNMHGILKTFNIHEALNVRDTNQALNIHEMSKVLNVYDTLSIHEAQVTHHNQEVLIKLSVCDTPSGAKCPLSKKHIKSRAAQTANW